ncbi:helix-turn-helix domain-containing protein [Streptomyces syringium]|uniref:helix-turn-helix domain-containing protein n=1 Tax=Streptomyces syringium TaxID=76729 RepID=UPI0034568594
MGNTQLAPGANVAALRKTRGWSQAHPARKAAVSVSLLSWIKIERALTPAVAAAIGRALGLSMVEVLGRAPVAQGDEARLAALRSAIRDFGIPGKQRSDPQLLKLSKLSGITWA